MTPPLLVPTEWLAARLDDPSMRVVDVRWSVLDPDRGRIAYETGHVPGAAFMNVDTDLSSPRGEGPGRHPLPTATRFAEVASRVGIGAGTHVVAYDFGDGSTAARLWWLLRHFGHERASLLDGGFARWSAEGWAVDDRVPAFAPAPFHAAPSPTRFVDAADVERLRRDPGALVLDVRAPERYEGRVEPIDPVAGHVPGARNAPFAANVRSVEDPRFRDPAELRARFSGLGAEGAERIVCYCGSGVNACQGIFSLELAGLGGALLYEGSWSDWCSDPSRPVATGA